MIGPRLVGIRLHPIKSLDPIDVEQARVLPSGALEGDRRWALFDGQARFVNGKRCEAVHRLRTRFDANLGGVTMAGRWFSLRDGVPELEAALSVALGQPVHVGRNDEVGFPDDLESPGPTLVSTASLAAVAGWFDGLTVDSVRRRFRANLEIDGGPAFWEDQLFGAAGTSGAVVRFRIGDVLVEGTNPCQRCAVPPRDPDTGEARPGFQKTFAERRRETLPPWAERSRFDHFYRFALNTRIPASEAGKTLRVGDRVILVAKPN